MLDIHEAATLCENKFTKIKVKAANSEGVWNNEGVTLDITINPPFWQTAWFYALCVIIILSGFWSFLKYRTSAIISK